MKNESWFDACLTPGETVQWTGRPAMHFPHAHTDGVAALSVLALFVMVWGLTKLPLADYPPAVVTLTFMVVMAVIPAAAWLAGSAFVRRPWLIRHTEYVVTDRRILRRRGRTVDSMCFLSMPSRGWSDTKTGGAPSALPPPARLRGRKTPCAPPSRAASISTSTTLRMRTKSSPSSVSCGRSSLLRPCRRRRSP